MEEKRVNTPRLTKTNMIYYLMLHHIGVACTTVVLQRCKFDTDLKCEMVARNIWSGMYCILFTWCGIQFQVERLQYAQLGYVASDVLLMQRMPQFKTNENYIHHVCCFVLVTYTVLTGKCLYGLIHLGGIGEFSTVLLAVADTFKNLPWLQRRFPRTNTFFRVCFFIAFVAIRVCWWTYVILIRAPLDFQLHLIVFWCAFYGLLLLQYYWFALMLRWLCRLLDSSRIGVVH